MEERVVDVRVAAYLPAGVEEPDLIAPDELQHQHLAHSSPASAPVTQSSLGPPVTVKLDEQGLVPRIMNQE